MNLNCKFKTLVFAILIFLLGSHKSVYAQDRNDYFRCELGTIMHIFVPDTIVDSVAFISFNADITDTSILPRSLVIPGRVNIGGSDYNVVVADEAFKDCDWIDDVVMEDGVVRIYANAFNGCSNLQSVFIPRSVDFVHREAFCNTLNLSTIKISEENERYDSRNDCNAVIAGDVLDIGCKGTKIPCGVKVIGYGAFYDCVGLDSIYIPDGVTGIMGQAFEGCTNLRHVRLPKNLSEIVGRAFAHCTSLEDIYIPASVKYIYGNPFMGCTGMRTIVVDKYNAEYDSRKSCNAIIEKRRNRLISTCKNTIIPKSVKEYSWCFAYMPIKEIHIPAAITFIDPFAFEGCSKLERITVDRRNTVYDSREDCNAIIQKNGNILIAGCYNTHIPSDVIEIGERAFYGRKLSADFDIGQRVQRIMNKAFANCAGLQHVLIPYTVYYMDSEAFTNCRDLQKAQIEAPINEIPPRTFLGCTKLEEINLPYSVRIIGRDAFKGCVMLRNIGLKRGVDIIDEGAFDGCPTTLPYTTLSDTNNLSSRGAI